MEILRINFSRKPSASTHIRDSMIHICKISHKSSDKSTRSSRMGAKRPLNIDRTKHKISLVIIIKTFPEPLGL